MLLFSVHCQCHEWRSQPDHLPLLCNFFRVFLGFTIPLCSESEWGSTSVVLMLRVYTTRGKMNNLMQCCQQLVAMLCCTLSNNVVLHTVEQCCAAPCQQLLLTTIAHSCSRSTTIVQSLLTTTNKLFSSTIVDSCSNNIVTTIVLCQHRTTIDQTILINIVNSTSVVEP